MGGVRGKIGNGLAVVGRYVARHHIGLLALFIALGGTAYAVTTAPRNSVVSKSIRSNAVRSSDVKDRGLGPDDLKLGRRLDRAGVDLLNSATTSLDAGSLTIKVPASGLVAIFAHTELSTDISGSSSCSLNVRSPGETLLAPLIQESSDTSGSTFFTYETTPGSDPTKDFGATGRARGGWVVFPTQPGTRTFDFAFSRLNFGGTATCRFRNTQINLFAVG
ncbi:hypothetical protein BH10ACT11_BH10ACT11_00210 [soil metagenome]